MELELVEFVHRHHVDALLDEGLVVIIARGIEHQSTPRVGRCIGGLKGGNLPEIVGAALVAVDLGGQGLQEGLQGVESAGGIVRLDRDALSVNAQLVTLGLGRSKGVDGEDNLPLRACAHRQIPARGSGQSLAKPFGLGPQGLVGRNRSLSSEMEWRAARLLVLERTGHNRA